MSEILLKRISELCEKKDISRRQLQRDLNLSSSTITKWKTSTPKPDTLQAVADYFGVTIDYLTGKSPYMNQDHMFKVWEEKYGNSKTMPDIMLPDGTIVGFKSSEEGILIESTGSTDYTYIDTYTRIFAEKLMKNKKLKELMQVLDELPQDKFDAVYHMIQALK